MDIYVLIFTIILCVLCVVALLSDRRSYDFSLLKELRLKAILKRKTSIAKAKKENFFFHATQDAYEISLIRNYCIKEEMKLEVTPMCFYYCCKLSWE